MDIRRTVFGLTAVITSLLLHGLCPSSGWAATVSWINALGGNWNNPDNWDADMVPGPADSAAIVLAGTYTVTLDVNASVASLTLGGASGSQTLSAAGRTLTLGSASAVDANGLLSMSNGTIGGLGPLTNAGTLALTACTINAPLVNQGLLRAMQTTNLNGAVSTSAGSTLRLESTNFTASLTAANGFTNNGTIEMTPTFGTGAILNVTSGALVNAPAGVINVLAGTGGTRTLGVQLDNQGTLFVGADVTITKASADHVNSGTIDVSGGNLNLAQGGTTPSFTNSGALTIAVGRAMSVSGGSWIYNGGSLSGNGALSLTTLTMILNAGLSNASVVLSLSSSTVNGPGTLTSAADQALPITACTINAPLANQGLLRVMQTTAFGGAVSTAAGSTLRLESTNFTASLTVANGFTNNGTIEMLPTLGTGANLNVTSGALVNAPGGVINVLAGTGGSRTLSAQLDNQGALIVGGDVTITKASADHVNSGTIEVSGGNLTLAQSGTTPSFTNSGALTIAAGRAMNVSGGSWIYNGGLLGGNGALSLTTLAMTLNTGLSNAYVALSLSSSTVNGPGTLTNAVNQTLPITACTINAPLANQGLLRVQQTTTFSGAVSTSAGSTLRLESTNFTASLTVANGFTNNGTIEMTPTLGTGVILNVTSGTLVNAPGGAINGVAGSGGSRSLNAKLDNQGTLSVDADVTINKASADHVSSGTIEVSGGNLTLTQSGATPSFTNSGVLSIGSGRTVTISGGAALNTASAKLRGGGTLAVSTSAFSNAGQIAPGASPGVLVVSGNAPMSATTVLAFELGGYAPATEFDRLAVSGAVSLAGALDLALVNGFVPVLGDSFPVLSAGSLSGAFSCLRGTEIGGGLAVVPVFGSTSLTLAVVSSTSTNSAPNATDDGATTAFDTPIVIPILENDSDPNGDPIVLRSLDQEGTSGSAAVNAGGESITFTPLLFFIGEDTLRYTIGDCHGGSDVALVVVNVGPATGVELPEEPMPTPADLTMVDFAARLEAGGKFGIVLALPREADIEIDLFDVQGRWVDRIAEKRLAAGRHDLPWESPRLASGVYFAQLVARTGTEESRRTTRVLLIR